MNLRLPLLMLAAFVLTACAGRAVRDDTRSVYTQDVGHQVLPPQPAVAGSSAIQSYSPQPLERFRMPEALLAPTPTLPESALIAELAPTRICARVAIAADGSVMFADNLSTRVECLAGNDPDNAALVEAMLTAVRGWRFQPAAMCRYNTGAPMPHDEDSCDGAQQIEPVPVTLQFAFTFEVREGRAQVRTGTVGR
jgi:hypothetical protein